MIFESLMINCFQRVMIKYRSVTSLAMLSYNQTLISNLGVMWNEMKLVITEHQMSLMLVWINIQRKRKQRAVMNYDHQTE